MRAGPVSHCWARKVPPHILARLRPIPTVLRAAQRVRRSKRGRAKQRRIKEACLMALKTRVRRGAILLLEGERKMTAHFL
ncbi:hypothetical protein AA15669_0510 [Saccharibacter floricola DSM 15669]|uniref:Uncharacterized protein n=1 Tax=Saccharibacter floricola DSM 15669 TaxID=1123227 RepID=A0ABQ0P0H9_9PROT|nr:hypothetical protein AA15669_0510 [Saccharibacter floricola DSM 15669]